MKIIVNIHATIRRNLYWLERLFLATGFTFLLSELVNASKAYPVYWDTVVLASVFLLMLTSPVAGYFAFVLALAYPIAQTSIYPAVFFLAVALLGQHWFTRNLDAVLLVLLTPFLNGIYLAWLTPLLAGLWWGNLSGLIAGIFSALWTKFLFGLTGISADYLALLGLYPNTELILTRLNAIDSAQFLQLPVSIFAPDSTFALYHFLQVAAWGFCGWLIGELTMKDKVQYQRPRTTIGLLTLGTILLAIVHLGLPTWMNYQYPVSPADVLLLSAFPALSVSIVIELLTYFFERPFPYAPIPAMAATGAPVPLDMHRLATPPQPEVQSESVAKENPDDDSVIMIELD